MNRNVFVAALVLFAACKDKKNANGEPVSIIKRVEQEKNAKRAPVLGKRVLEGDVQELRGAPDGSFVTVLLDAVKPSINGVPPPMRQGALWLVPTGAGAPRKLGNGVVNTPGGWLISQDSRWVLFSGGYDPQQATGELFVQDAKNPDAERQRLSPRASYFVPSDDGSMVAFIEGGVLHAGKLPDGPFPQLAGDVSTAEFSADTKYLYFRRKLAAAGGLYQLDLSQARPEPKRLLDQVTEFTVLRSGKHVVVNARATPSASTTELHVFDVKTLKGTRLSEDAVRYRISRDGQFIAWRNNPRENDVGELTLARIDGSNPKVLGKQVKDFDFSPDGTRFLFRDNYAEVPRMGAEASRGEALVAKVADLMLLEMKDGAEAKRLVRQSENFTFAPSGGALAFTARIDRPEVTRRLYLYPVGATEPRALVDWLYEYRFSEAGDRLFYRSGCLREGRACELNSISATPAADEKPKKESDGVYTFRLTTDASRALIASAHLTDLTYDIAMRTFATGQQTIIDQYVEWPALLLSNGAVTYLVKEKSRPGLYLATGL